MFRGASQIAIDGKGRMAIPARYRDPLVAACDGQMVVTVDPDECLLVYPLPAWEAVERELVSLANLDRRARQLQRILMGYATEMAMDGQGRLQLTPLLRKFAHLESRGMLIGQGNKFELWAEEHWNARQAEWMNDLRQEDGAMSAALQKLSI
ncbi:MAG TPA: division/cell wall cluster transcriptional repressor MraZ [Candidatus Acidoferrales bacterium]|nr:division/cell wall cluster transcriptional repressor MraZ [Candidatus Acidoferrales bacterium]